MLTHVLLCEVLRLANACAGQNLFTWHLRTVTGAPVAAEDGTLLPAEQPDWYGAQGFDLVLLCAGDAPLRHLPMGLRAFLLRAGSAGAVLGGVDGGALVLARLGLLQGHEAVLPPGAGDLLDGCPDIARACGGFRFDRQRLTAAGGLAAADAALAWIARVQGPALAAEVAQRLSLGQVRDAGARQALAICADPVIERMQAIMAANLSQPVPVARVAADLGLSAKQLRLRCRKAMQRTPAQVYLDLRLDRARSLVRDTALSVREVAAAAGFASPSAFTRSYHARFGIAPQGQRRARDLSKRRKFAAVSP